MEVDERGRVVVVGSVVVVVASLVEVEELVLVDVGGSVVEVLADGGGGARSPVVVVVRAEVVGVTRVELVAPAGGGRGGGRWHGGSEPARWPDELQAAAPTATARASTSIGAAIGQPGPTVAPVRTGWAGHANSST